MSPLVPNNYNNRGNQKSFNTGERINSSGLTQEILINGANLSS
jgi:hypothetical protein